MQLHPLEPIICRRVTSCYDAARLMSAHRENCVLVVDSDGKVEGIVTAKDLAFRVVGEPMLASSVSLEKIMTPDPICTHVSCIASEALDLMVEKRFRHLPVLDDDGNVVGVLDIAQAYLQHMEKLERLHESALKLYEALDSVNTELDLNDQPRQVYDYFQNLHAKVKGPSLQLVVNDTTSAVFVSDRASVYEATDFMKKHNTTAVLVRARNLELAGIFTSKDVVLRVIAAGLDPRNCSLVRVMTPKPDTAHISTTIQSALRQMFNGHYLNLPVVEGTEVVAVVDVLLLIYATLDQIKRIQTSTAVLSPESSSKQDLLWEGFWLSPDQNDQTSAGLHSNHSGNYSPRHELYPSDSVSFVRDDHPDSSTAISGSSLQKGDFVFKFKWPVSEERFHRITLRDDQSLERLRDLIDKKLSVNSKQYSIYYLDDDDDLVAITSDSDLYDCICQYWAMSANKAELFLHFSVDGIASPEKQSESTDNLDSGTRNAIILTSLIGLAAITGIIIYKIRR